MRPNIIFRTRGNRSTGLGHLYRIYALIEMVKSELDYTLLIDRETEPDFIPKDYPIEIVPAEISLQNEAAYLKANYNPNTSIVVADGYMFDSQYQKLIKDAGFKMIYIDDLASEHIFADVVINHSVAVREEHFTSTSYTRTALGSDYAILRPGFLEKAKDPPGEAIGFNLFICFGGADALNLSYQMAAVAMKLEKIDHTHVVVGAAYCYDEIHSLAATYPDRLTVHQNLNEQAMIHVMERCQLAIASASTICYELCCLKIPILGGFFVDNQVNIYNGLKELGAIVPLGDFNQFYPERLKEVIEQVIKDKKIIRAIQRKQKVAFDGRSRERILKIINELL